jgi:hypothetical protein
MKSHSRHFEAEGRPRDQRDPHASSNQVEDGQDFVCFLNDPGSESRAEAKAQHTIVKSFRDRGRHEDKTTVTEPVDALFGPIWCIRLLRIRTDSSWTKRRLWSKLLQTKLSQVCLSFSTSLVMTPLNKLFTIAHALAAQYHGIWGVFEIARRVQIALAICRSGRPSSATAL